MTFIASQLTAPEPSPIRVSHATAQVPKPTLPASGMARRNRCLSAVRMVMQARKGRSVHFTSWMIKGPRLTMKRMHDVVARA
jgi:hypothetical protein